MHYFASFLVLRLSESWLLCFYCLVTVNVLWLIFTVPWVGLQCVIVVFRDHSHLLFEPLVGGHVSINNIMLSSVYLETFYDCIRLY